MTTEKLNMRIAFRREGEFWNAYLALPNTMDGAELLGSIVMGAVETSPEIKTAFMDLMKKVLAIAVERTTGQLLDKWHTSKAPESERAGHG